MSSGGIHRCSFRAEDGLTDSSVRLLVEPSGSIDLAVRQGQSRPTIGADEEVHVVGAVPAAILWLDRGLEHSATGCVSGHALHIDSVQLVISRIAQVPLLLGLHELEHAVDRAEE